MPTETYAQPRPPAADPTSSGSTPRVADSSGRLSWLIAVVFGTVFLWLLAATLVAPLYGMATWDRLPVTLLLAGLLVTTPIMALKLGRIAPRLERRGTLRQALVSMTLTVSLLMQMKIGVAVAKPMDWDAGIVLSTAARLGTGKPIDASTLRYFAQYPNNAFLASLLGSYLHGFSMLGILDPIAILLLNAVSLTSASLLSYLTARRVGGPTAAYLVLLLGFPFLTLSPWVAVPYSDTLGIAFPVLVLYLSVRARATNSKWSQAALWLAIGVVGAAAYQVKPPLVFAVIAALTVTLLQARRRPFAAGVSAVVLGLAVGFGIGLSGASALIEHEGLAAHGAAREAAFPLTHFLKMGAQHHPGPYNEWYGAWSRRDVDQTAAMTPGPQRFWDNLKIYRRRVAAMGPVGYLAFLNAKARWCFGDGSFSQWGEGTMATAPFLSPDGSSRALQRVYGQTGVHHWLLIDFWQACWLLLLALMAAPMLMRARASLASQGATTMRIAVLLLLAFLLLFEGRARYVYVYVPYFVLLAALALATLSSSLGPRDCSDPH